MLIIIDELFFPLKILSQFDSGHHDIKILVTSGNCGGKKMLVRRKTMIVVFCLFS